MVKEQIPEYKIKQRESRAAVKASRRVIHYGGTTELGIKQFKRLNPDMDAETISRFKQNAWASFDPKDIIVRPKPQQPKVYHKPQPQMPAGMSNHARHTARQGIRKIMKERQHDQTA